MFTGLKGLSGSAEEIRVLLAKGAVWLRADKFRSLREVCDAATSSFTHRALAEIETPKLQA